jgi:hypothetical protein
VRATYIKAIVSVGSGNLHVTNGRFLALTYRGGRGVCLQQKRQCRVAHLAPPLRNHGGASLVNRMMSGRPAVGYMMMRCNVCMQPMLYKRIRAEWW